MSAQRGSGARSRTEQRIRAKVGWTGADWKSLGADAPTIAHPHFTGTGTRKVRSGLLDSRPGWYSTVVTFTIELEREDDGRWIAEVPTLPGVLCYGKDRDEAVAGVQALALRVIAERLEQREAPAEFLNVTFHAA